MMYMMESRAVVDWVAVLVVGAGELVVVLMPPVGEAGMIHHR